MQKEKTSNKPADHGISFIAAGFNQSKISIGEKLRKELKPAVYLFPKILNPTETRNWLLFVLNE